MFKTRRRAQPEDEPTRSYVPERVAAPGLLGVLQDDWTMASLTAASLCLATWGPVIPGGEHYPLAAALHVLAEQSSRMNLFVWQVVFGLSLAARFVGKLEIRRRLPDRYPRMPPGRIRYLVGGVIFWGLGWALVAMNDVHRDGSCRSKCWESWFQDPIFAAIALSVLSFITLGTALQVVVELTPTSKPTTSISDQGARTD